jgi:hypothetical protein
MLDLLMSAPRRTAVKKLALLGAAAAFSTTVVSAQEARPPGGAMFSLSGVPSVAAIAPIFGQLVMMSQPAYFKVGFEKTTDDRYIREAVPADQTIEQWREMITVTGAKGLASNPAITPLGVVQNLAAGFEKSCPDTFVVKPLGGTKYGAHDVFLALASCGTVKAAATTYSETALIIAIKGAADIYTIQWAERGPASEKPMPIEDAKWLDRYKRVGPIRLCPIVPGETAPFPSCVNGK